MDRPRYWRAPGFLFPRVPAPVPIALTSMTRPGNRSANVRMAIRGVTTMNTHDGTHSMQRRWSGIAQAAAGLALWVVAGAAWSANDLDTPAAHGTLNPDGSDTYHAEWLGHNDLQGRTTYQVTVHNQGNRVIAYAGHFAGQMLNPMTGVTEENGTSIVDVTDPRNPKYLKHLV